MSPAGARRSVVWAVAGGVVLLIALIAVIVTVSTRTGDHAVMHSPTGTSSSDATPSPSASTSAHTSSDVVDADSSRFGWLPEPITHDKDAYIRAALEAASTFDPEAATRDEFLAYLGTWFTADTRWESQSDRDASKQQYLLELTQSVVVPEAQWAELRAGQTKVTATADGPITYVDVPDDPGGMFIGTADVTVHYSYNGTTGDDRRVRVSVQVLCGPDTVPAPNSSQRAGDCKVVRYFPSAMEP